MTNQKCSYAQGLFGHFPQNLKNRFKAFNKKNPSVLDEFIKNSLKMLHSGTKRYSAYAVMHKIRWDKNIQTQGSLFKIDDSFTPIYARLAEYYETRLKGFFEFRK